MKTQAAMQEALAWTIGAYVRIAASDAINGGDKYPSEPRDVYSDNENQNQDTDSRRPHGAISDGQRFALYMVNHNRVLSDKRGRKVKNA